MSAQTVFSPQRHREHTPAPQRVPGPDASQAHILSDAAQKRPPLLPMATIFHEPWWLSVTTDDSYEEALVTSETAVVGRLPYLRLRKIGWQTALVMPAMTHALGPSLSSDLPGGEHSRSLRRFTICSALIDQLPKAGHIWFALHRGETETLAFEAAGFSTAVTFTVDIAPNHPDLLWRGMRDKTRNVIRRAQEQLTAQAIDAPALFLDFYERNLRDTRRQNHYDRRICGNLMAACLQRGRGRILSAVDAAGELQAAIFTVWDHEAEYYLMSTRAPASGNGAISMLIWTAMQEAAAHGRTFDLDGIDCRTNRLLLTGFGGTIRPRYLVSRTSTEFRIARCLKTTLKNWTTLAPRGLRKAG
jgi:hypothetical protein